MAIEIMHRLKHATPLTGDDLKIWCTRVPRAAGVAYILADSRDAATMLAYVDQRADWSAQQAIRERADYVAQTSVVVSHRQK